MAPSPKVSSADIDMPEPYGFAPAPGLRWETGIDFAARNIHALITLWHGRRPSRHGLPSYGQFDALELRPWADHLIVLELDITLFGKRCFRYRTVGAAASAVEGGNFSGLYLSDALSPAQADPRIEFYERAMRARGAGGVAPADGLRRPERIGRGHGSVGCGGAAPVGGPAPRRPPHGADLCRGAGTALTPRPSPGGAGLRPERPR